MACAEVKAAHCFVHQKEAHVLACLDLEKTYGSAVCSMKKPGSDPDSEARWSK